jgi:hypothetical protein
LHFSGTEYCIKVRTGLAGSHTWSGTPDWGAWSAAAKFKTSGEARHAHGGSGNLAGKGSKKKKNRDAAFAAMFNRKSDAGEGDEEEEETDAADEESKGVLQSYCLSVCDQDNFKLQVAHMIAGSAEYCWLCCCV